MTEIRFYFPEYLPPAVPVEGLERLRDSFALCSKTGARLAEVIAAGAAFYEARAAELPTGRVLLKWNGRERIQDTRRPNPPASGSFPTYYTTSGDANAIPADNLRRWFVIDEQGRVVNPDLDLDRWIVSTDDLIGCTIVERARRLQLGALPQLSRLSIAIAAAWRPPAGPVP